MRIQRTLCGIVILAAVVLFLGCGPDPQPPVPVITITAQPQAVTVIEKSISGGVTVSATVTEGASLTYQWYSNTNNSNSGGAIITGAVGASYTIPTTLKAGTYYYFCEVSATGGAASKRSDTAAVTVYPAGTVIPVITITTQPASTTVIEGSITGSVTVTATVTGGKTPKYQWYSNNSNSNTDGTIITGAVGASYTIPATLQTGTYYYFCEVSADGVTPKRSNAAAVTVKPQGTAIPVITITAQPKDAAVVAGSITGNVTVSATVTEGKTLRYQWYSNTSDNNSGGAIITGAAGASYTIPTTLKAGTYYYYCEVQADGAEAKTSETVSVTVNGTTVIVVQPMGDPNLLEQAVEAAANTNKVFTIAGTGYTAHQWYVDGEIQNANGAAYTFNKPAGTYELMVVVTGAAGLQYSGSCRVTVGGIQ